MQQNTLTKLFSLIIPCHNPEKTIGRLFDSLTRQSIPMDDLEIIVVDDNSDSLEYRNILQTYGFNLIFAETNTNVHCPGNTRREGMKYVHGKWVFFCDQDDYFENNALFKIKEYIKSQCNKNMYVISTIMRSYNEEEGVAYKEHVHKEAWLHGKWYSMENLIKPYNINFKEDLVTHEDIYFNSSILAKLFELGQDWDYLDICTYRWVDNPESITRKPTNDRGYLFENFGDYFEAASMPFWEYAKDENNMACRNQIMMNLLHAYFYYECVSYLYGGDDYKDIIEIIRNHIHRIIDELGMSKEYIVDYVYGDAYKYYRVYEDCAALNVGFIPKTSFRDFVFRLSD